MNKSIILYRSKYGAAQTYAQWLAELTGFLCVALSKEVWRQAAECQTLVLCGGVYASGIAGLSALKKHLPELNAQRVAVFCVGASPYDKEALEQLRLHNMTGPLQSVPLFYGRGAWDESRMSLPDRTLCRMLQRSVAKKDPADCEPWMRALMSAAGQRCDWTDRSYLLPLLEHLAIEPKK